MQLRRVDRQVLATQRLAQYRNQRFVGVHSGGAAAQQRGVTGFQRQTERVDGDVGPAFVDDADDTERDTLLTQGQPVGQGVAAQYLADRVRQTGDLAQSRGDPLDALGVQGQPVDHRGRRVGRPGRAQVIGVGRQDPVGVGHQRIGGDVQRLVLGDRRQ